MKPSISGRTIAKHKEMVSTSTSIHINESINANPHRAKLIAR